MADRQIAAILRRDAEALVAILTDFVVAAPDQLDRIGRSHQPGHEFKGVTAKGIDIVKLGKLDAILTNSPYDPTFLGNSCLRFEGSPDGPWVYELPLAFVRRLAELEPLQLDTTTKAWSAITEFSPRYDNWPVEAVTDVLEELMSQCRKALQRDQSLYLWISL